jgi:hypothetical protein
MAFYAKNNISHGLADGTTVNYVVGDELDPGHFTDSELATLIANDAAEEHDGDTWSGDRPGGPLERQDPEASGTVSDVNLPEEEPDVAADTAVAADEKPIEPDDHQE